MDEEEKKLMKKMRQAAAHKKWALSPKGKAYLQRKKEREALRPDDTPSKSVK